MLLFLDVEVWYILFPKHYVRPANFILKKISFQVQKLSQRLPTTMSDLMSGSCIFWSVEVVVVRKIDPSKEKVSLHDFWS